MTNFGIKIYLLCSYQSERKRGREIIPTPFFLVPRAGVEPARWGTTEGF